MTLFEKIKETASLRGKSLSEVSIEAGLGKTTIYKWRQKEPSISRIKAVADVLNVSVDYLLENTEDMHGTHDKLRPEDVTIRNKIDTSGLTEEELEKLNSYLEFLKSEHARIMNERKK